MVQPTLTGVGTAGYPTAPPSISDGVRAAVEAPWAVARHDGLACPKLLLIAILNCIGSDLGLSDPVEPLNLAHGTTAQLLETVGNDAQKQPLILLVVHLVYKHLLSGNPLLDTGFCDVPPFALTET